MLYTTKFKISEEAFVMLDSRIRKVTIVQIKTTYTENNGVFEDYVVRHERVSELLIPTLGDYSVSDLYKTKEDLVADLLKQ